MKVLVLGAGVVGATTAYMLARDGLEVTVLERRETSGLETSFANGGQISASHTEAWANPGTLLKAMKWLWRGDAPLYVAWWRFDPALWVWMVRFLSNCTESRFRRNTLKALDIALYSRKVLGEIRAETDIAYDRQDRGILHIYRDSRSFEKARGMSELMAGHGMVREPKTPDECLALEPALAHVHPRLAGGLYSPLDESGDAFAFTRGITDRARALGADFRFGAGVTALRTDKGRISGVVTTQGEFSADLYVLSLGCESVSVARSAGLRLPIYPAKGYSITIPTTGHAGAPHVSVTDDENKIVYSRLGERLRAAGTAEFSGWDRRADTPRAHVVLNKCRELFPEAGNYSEPNFWAGLRPKTPDSVPLIGPTPFENLLLNTGHGYLGWTMASGSAKVIADMVSGRRPEIDVEGAALTRFG